MTTLILLITLMKSPPEDHMSQCFDGCYLGNVGDVDNIDGIDEFFLERSHESMF